MLFSAPPSEGQPSGGIPPDGDPLEEWTAAELKALAKARGLTGCSTMNKADLIKAIGQASGGSEG